MRASNLALVAQPREKVSEMTTSTGSPFRPRGLKDVCRDLRLAAQEHIELVSAQDSGSAPSSIKRERNSGVCNAFDAI
jgi:hypothetical protein